MPHNFQKILIEQIIKLHNFCPNCPLPQNGLMSIALHYAKMFLKISRAVNTSCVIFRPNWAHIALKGDFFPIMPQNFKKIVRK